jgi:HD-like signal output (HDOD) protein
LTELASANPCLERILNRSGELAVLPHVVHKVLEITASEDASCHDLERAIAIDPGFTSRLLVLANSAAFGLPRRVTSIQEAILFLGYRTIRSAALTVGVFDVFVGKTDKDSLRRREWWRHSVDTALCGRFLAKTTELVPLEDAYTSGLLHLIGKMLLDKYGGRDFGDVEKRIGEGMSDSMAETEVYGVDHCAVSASVAGVWNLPGALQSGLRYLEPAEPDDPFGALRACTTVSTYIALVAKRGVQEDDVPCAGWALERLGLDPLSMADLVEQGRRSIAEAELRI